MPKLIKRTVDAARPGPRESFVWGNELPGFGLRVFPSGRKTFFVQYRARAQSRTRRYVLGPYGVLTPAEARDLAIEVLAQVRKGRDPSEERRVEAHAPTVADLCARYVKDYAEGRKKPRSVAEDRRLIDDFIKPALGRRKLRAVTRLDIVRLHNSLQHTPYQANRVLAVVSRMFNLAERWGLRPDGSNAVRHVDRFAERKRERFLSEAELARLGKALGDAERAQTENAATVAAVRLLVFTGCRLGEIRGLRWQDVDFERRCLRLPDSKTGARIVPLNAPALQVLADLERGDSPWVIRGRKRGASLVNLGKPWRRIREAARLPDVRIHDLRHSFASVAAGTGHSLVVIGALLGHRQATTTHRYAHLSDDPVRKASERVGARIASAMRAGPPATKVGERLSDLREL
jgi:integrase